MNKKTVRDVDVAGKRVLVRVDLNVALDKQGNINDDTRLRASLDTIRYLLDRHARVILMSHLGRPDGVRKAECSLKPVGKALAVLLGQPVECLDDCVGPEVEAYCLHQLKDGQVVLLENLRFHAEEEANNAEFAQKLAALADIYVNDAFGTAHRAHASTEGVAHYRTSVAGLLMEKELEHLGQLLESPERPFTAILGGSKASTKIGVIRNLLETVKVDQLLLGGGMTFAFLKAMGKGVGDSTVDDKSLAGAKEVLKDGLPSNLQLPDDVMVTDRPFNIKEPLDPAAHYKVVPAEAIPDGWQGVDIGPSTIKRYRDLIWGSQTVVWNGPVGVFEIKEFAEGTSAIADAVATSDAVSVVGGGESVAAVHQAGVAHRITWISTGGGASLEFLEGKALPGVVALEDKDAAAAGPGPAVEIAGSALPATGRTPFVAGNWKMNGQGELAVELAASIREQIKGIAGVEVAICPTFLSLESVAHAFAGTGIKVGGQDLFWRDSGAYTGKVSGPMLKAAGASLVILGHSECRGRFGKAEADVTTETIKQFGDNDATLALKVRAALKADLDVILCCGETLPERQAGQTDAIVAAQVEAVLRGLSAADLRRVTVAYEPVWAIGTGQTCDAAEANRVCGVIRGVVARVGGAEAGAGMRIQYGGSVNAENAVEILSQPEIDGALVGGASLKPGAFAQIVRAGR